MKASKVITFILVLASAACVLGLKPSTRPKEAFFNIRNNSTETISVSLAYTHGHGAQDDNSSPSPGTVAVGWRAVKPGETFQLSSCTEDKPFDGGDVYVTMSYMPDDYRPTSVELHPKSSASNGFVDQGTKALCIHSPMPFLSFQKDVKGDRELYLRHGRSGSPCEAASSFEYIAFANLSSSEYDIPRNKSDVSNACDAMGGKMRTYWKVDNNGSYTIQPEDVEGRRMERKGRAGFMIKNKSASKVYLALAYSTGGDSASASNSTGIVAYGYTAIRPGESKLVADCVADGKFDGRDLYVRMDYGEDQSAIIPQPSASQKYDAKVQVCIRSDSTFWSFQDEGAQKLLLRYGSTSPGSQCYWRQSYRRVRFTDLNSSEYTSQNIMAIPSACSNMGGEMQTFWKVDNYGTYTVTPADVQTIQG